MNVKQYVEYYEKVRANCSKVIVGKDECIRKIVIAYLAGGHILLEDVPGTGKTILFRAFSKSVGGSDKRIQFTPDIMPSDLTGINFFNQKSGEFEFRPGPLFAQMVLADEINRATPRTQSSLLEAMAEGQITVDGTTYPMAKPFMVMATQNPLESGGTFPLPEAQKDRFMMKLSLGYMLREEELTVLTRESSLNILERIGQVVSTEETIALQENYHQIEVSEPVKHYIMDIVDKTRGDRRIMLGASTRAALSLYRGSQLMAATAGRGYVIPEDVKDLAGSILEHRMSFAGVIRDNEAARICREIIEEVPVPIETRSNKGEF
ncbi:MAG: methanol dehydrogenase regulatory protein [Herbinix sp.]|jgi:MoxR-like ATPase|nr:methanol dehydrogenase regulatory protein [Herbinix sp.]